MKDKPEPDASNTSPGELSEDGATAFYIDNEGNMHLTREDYEAAQAAIKAKKQSE